MHPEGDMKALIIAAIVVFTIGMVLAEPTPRTTIKWTDGGTTTVYGPVGRLPDGGTKVYFR
jgi:hypothetical protein